MAKSARRDRTNDLPENMTADNQSQARDFDAQDLADPAMHPPKDMTPKENELSKEWANEETTKPDDATGRINPADANSARMMDGDVGRVGPIGKDEVAKAYEIFTKYKNGKSGLERRIVENEQWWKRRHWDVMAQDNKKAGRAEDPRPVSAWLFNSLANKHADAMDNYPTINVLPREPGDVQDARLLTEIMPVIIERNNFKKTYNDGWWYKLKQGTAVYGVFWDNSIDNGIGDVNIKRVDLLNLFWQPGIQDIQQSRNVFNVELVDNDVLEQAYPFLAGKTGTDIYNVEKYVTEDYIDTSEKTAVFDWYYKQRIGTREVMHYCKFACGEEIYATENDPEYAERGWYDHALYPFVFDCLFPIETSPVGYGYIDVMKDPQMYIDKLNQVISKNALLASKTRYLVKANSGISQEDFMNFENDIVECETNLDDDHFRELRVSPLPASVINYMSMRVDELKEPPGNRDFSQGQATAGVTAASAIAALQEAGSKLSRDMIAASYNAYEQMNRMVLELIRQFYEETRFFRVVGENGMDEFVEYDNRNIREQVMEEMMGVEQGFRKPIFDIKIVAEKQSPFARISQNELAIQLYNLGVFNPQMADQTLGMLDMMEFEGKDAVIQKVRENQQMLQQIQMLQEQVAQLTAMIDMQNGTNLSGAAAESGMLTPPEGGRAPTGGRVVLSRPGNTGESGVTAKARARVAKAGTPRV